MNRLSPSNTTRVLLVLVVLSISFGTLLAFYNEGGGRSSATECVYVANQDSNNISQYTIGPNGVLIPMIPPAVAAGRTPVSVTVVRRQNRDQN
jgi:hypothetical protein